MDQLFFQGWEPIIRTAISTSTSYLALIILLRVAGQRTLAKWYAFDLIVTVALGSTFANTVLSKDNTIAQGLVGFVMLIGVWFVAFDRGAKGRGWAWANGIAADAHALGMGLTYSAHSEYGNAVDVVRVGPIVRAPKSADRPSCAAEYGGVVSMKKFAGQIIEEEKACLQE